MRDSITTVDGPEFYEMCKAALAWLTTNQDTVNSLNVYPIPDGDTGTNMVLPMVDACKEIGTADGKTVSEVANLWSHGAAVGGAGNSGIILSAICKGLARGLEGLEEFGATEFATAMQQGTEEAYSTPDEPVEGTILTVMKDASDTADATVKKSDDLLELLQQVVSACDESVQRTPDLLPILKAAGLVDAGGFGLLLVFEGMLRHLQDESLEEPIMDMSALMRLGVIFSEEDKARVTSLMEANDLSDVLGLYPVPPWIELDEKHKARLASDLEVKKLSEAQSATLELEQRLAILKTKFDSEGQEWEVVMDLRPDSDLDLERFNGMLKKIGTSINVLSVDDWYRVHIHLESEKRYEPIELAETLGTVVQVHMENLLDQISRPGQLVAVVVSPGPGFTNIFSRNAPCAIIPGGQTMNPQVKDFLDAFEDSRADQVIILPNNKNNILAAEKAAGISDKEVCVIPTHTLPQGVAAHLAFDPDGVFEEVCDAMRAGADEVKSGEITTATHSVNLNGHNVSKGEIIGLHNGEIACVGDTAEECTLELLRVIGMEQCDLVTLYHGEETDPGAAESLRSEIEACFSQVEEVQSYPGGQPHYHYILSVE